MSFPWPWNRNPKDKGKICDPVVVTNAMPGVGHRAERSCERRIGVVIRLGASGSLLHCLVLLGDLQKYILLSDPEPPEGKLGTDITILGVQLFGKASE